MTQYVCNLTWCNIKNRHVTQCNFHFTTFLKKLLHFLLHYFYFIAFVPFLGWPLRNIVKSKQVVHTHFVLLPQLHQRDSPLNFPSHAFKWKTPLLFHKTLRLKKNLIHSNISPIGELFFKVQTSSTWTNN